MKRKWNTWQMNGNLRATVRYSEQVLTRDQEKKRNRVQRKREEKNKDWERSVVKLFWLVIANFSCVSRVAGAMHTTKSRTVTHVCCEWLSECVINGNDFSLVLFSVMVLCVSVFSFKRNKRFFLILYLVSGMFWEFLCCIAFFFGAHKRTESERFVDEFQLNVLNDSIWGELMHLPETETTIFKN